MPGLTSNHPNTPTASSPGSDGAAGRPGVASPALDLQERFDVFPAEGQVGWMGGDAAVSVVIGCGPTGQRSLWIFADTFVTRYDPRTQSRVAEGCQMPHSTVGLLALSEGRIAGRVQYRWKVDAAGNAVSFFEPSPAQTAAGERLWPVAGVASRDGSSVLLMAQRTRGFLNGVGTTAIVIREAAAVADPRQWRYTTSDVGTAELTWWSSVFFAEREGDLVYLLGHATGAGGLQTAAQTVLARASLADLLEHNWKGLEYWVAPGRWSGLPVNLQSLGLPSWESTCTWSSVLGLWYSFHIPALGTEVFLYTAHSVTGPWTKTKVHDLPAPFHASPWLNYAANAHPELERRPPIASPAVPASGPAPPEVELVYTWISNVAPSDDGARLFEPQGMHWPQRGYWPRFMRVTIFRSEVPNAGAGTPSGAEPNDDSLPSDAPRPTVPCSGRRLSASPRWDDDLQASCDGNSHSVTRNVTPCPTNGEADLTIFNNDNP